MTSETGLNPHFDAALKVWLANHVNDRSGVEIITLAGVTCVVKRRQAKPMDGLVYSLRFLRSFTLSLLCWVCLGHRPPTQTLLKNGLADEADRLRLLSASGCNVPRIFHYSPGVLVLEFVGEDLPHFLRTSSAAGRTDWIRVVAQDLASFHRAGFIHGGAQLRNLMYENGKLTRIDFEENIGEAMVKPLGQAYDFYQMLSSLAGMRADEISSAERQALCNQMVHEYLLHNQDADVRRYLKNMGLAFAWIVRVLGPVLRAIPGKDVRGFLYVTHSLGVTLRDE